MYACLAGVAVNNVLKQASIKFGVKFANGLIKKIPSKVLTKINKKVGFRLIIKFGKMNCKFRETSTGIGAVIGGGLDLVETKIIAKRSYKWFFEHDFSVNPKDNEEDIEVYESDYEEVLIE